MKKYILIVVAIVSFSLSAEAQSKKIAKEKFQVEGVCKMCKNRIEKAVLKTKGVKFASWDVNSGELYCVFNTKKTSTSKIKKAIADVGHDTDEAKATQEKYDALPKCCRYRGGEVKKH